MQSITATQLTALNSNNRILTLKVQVTRPSGTIPSGTPNNPVDITNRVESVTINWDYERRNATCTLVIDNTDFAYSPKNMTSSVNLIPSGGISIYNPLLYPNRKLEVWFGVQTPLGNEQWKVFTGIMGDDIQVDSMPGKITVTCRDMSKVLQDYYVFMSKSYDALMAEQVLYALMINDYAPWLAWPIPPLQVPSASNWYVNHYQIKDTNLWDACQKLADMVGWVLIFKGDGTPWFYKPPFPSGTITPDLTLDQNLIVQDGYTITDTDVRNHILVKVQTPDADLISIDVTNQDSINEHGLRFMEVDRDIATRLTSAEQVRQLALAILRDLSWPQVKERMEIPLWPPLEPGDIITVTNPYTGLVSGNDYFRVTQITHTFSQTSKRTSVVTNTFKTINLGSTIPPAQVTGLTYSTISSTVQAYAGSGIPSGKTKTTHYPYLQWLAVTTDLSGNSLGSTLGGYNVYSGSSVNGPWIPIGMVRSVLAGNISGTYYIDYKFNQALTGVATGYYCVAAFTNTGIIGPKSTAIQVTVPAPVIQ